MKASKTLIIRPNSITSALFTLAVGSSILISTAAHASKNFSPSRSSQHISSSQLNTQDNDNIIQGAGFGVGAIVGGILGGPIGIVAGGAAGSFIGAYINTNSEIDELTQNLNIEKQSAKQKIINLEKSYEYKLQNIEQGYQQELISLEQSYNSSDQIKAQKLLMSLQFSSGSSEIAHHYQEQVAVLAQLLNSDKTLTVDLSGYTDLIGEESKNQALSLQRVESVKALLMAQGVDESKINTFAFGEAQPITHGQANEINFYDRRVVLQISNNEVSTAKN